MARLIACIVFAVCAAVATGGHTLGPTCYDCHDVDDPDDCTSLHTCPSDQVCSTELHSRSITPYWKFHCKKQQDCREFSRHIMEFVSLIGKKKRVETSDKFICSHCCTDTICQKASCTLNEFFGLTTARPATTSPPATTMAPATTPTTTTTTTTKATTTMLTTTQTQWPCIDLEARAGQCAQLKAGGYCRPIEGINYETAKLRCRHTCRFC